MTIDDADDQAHVILAIENQWYEWDWAAAEHEFKRAQELNPRNGAAYGYYSWFLPPLGRNDEAVEAARKLLELGPLDVVANGNLGSVFVYTHRWDEAIAQLRTAIDLDPNFWYDYNYLGGAYAQTGQLKQAIDTFQKGLTLEGNTELCSGLGYAYAMASERERHKTCSTSWARCRRPSMLRPTTSPSSTPA